MVLNIIGIASTTDHMAECEVKDLLSVSRMMLSAMFYENFYGCWALPQARRHSHLWSTAASVILFLCLTQTSH